jgi:hypothetical protein
MRRLDGSLYCRPLSGNVYGDEVATEGFPSVQGESKKREISSGELNNWLG